MGNRTSKILVVDDDQDTRDLLSEVLESDGYQVVVASGAQEALAAVVAASPLPATVLRGSLAIGWSGRGHGELPNVIDVESLDRDEPWRIDIDGRRPREAELDVRVLEPGSAAGGRVRARTGFLVDTGLSGG